MNENKVTATVLNYAKVLGGLAFANGNSGIPAHSSELNTLMSGLHLKIGEGGFEIMQSFTNGWHEGCDALLFSQGVI